MKRVLITPVITMGARSPPGQKLVAISTAAMSTQNKGMFQVS
jgi:hypothetical protein